VSDDRGDEAPAAGGRKSDVRRTLRRGPGGGEAAREDLGPPAQPCASRCEQRGDGGDDRQRQRMLRPGENPQAGQAPAGGQVLDVLLEREGERDPRKRRGQSRSSSPA
jgi:hypothetical protein